MPARHDIQNQILEAKNAAQDKIRRDYIKDLSDFTKRDTIIYISAFATPKMYAIPGAGPMISIVPDDIQSFMSAIHGLKNKELDLIIHSPGGSSEATEQIVTYLRSKYKHIRAIVPQSAMSAATMLACACDEIIMGKQSALGPIDPQITFPSPSGQMQMFTAPAQSIINEFEQAKIEIKKDKDTAALWVNRMQRLPFGILDICQKTSERSIELVEDWLGKYMFKGDKDAKDKANRIAKWLGEADKHKTHGKPISMAELINKGLKIVELESNQDFQDKVLSVFHASMITIMVTKCVKMVENQNGKGSFVQVETKPQKP